MTRYFYDTEFIEDGATIDLVSIGIVAEDGSEYYAVSCEFDVTKLMANPWLVQNVWPYLPQREEAYPRGTRVIARRPQLDLNHAAVKTRAEIAGDVQAFLLGGASPPELWAWYSAYDHVALCQLWGRMVDLPKGIPMWTNDLRQEVHRLGNPQMPKQNSSEHHALADARHNRAMYQLLQEETA